VSQLTPVEEKRAYGCISAALHQLPGQWVGTEGAAVVVASAAVVVADLAAVQAAAVPASVEDTTMA